MKENNIKNAFCPKCGAPLSPSDIKGYEYVCYDCDENFYEFEAVDKSGEHNFIQDSIAERIHRLTSEQESQVGKTMTLREALDAYWDYVVFPWGADGASCFKNGFNGEYEGLNDDEEEPIPLDLKVRITHYAWEDNGQGYESPVAYAEVI